MAATPSFYSPQPPLPLTPTLVPGGLTVAHLPSAVAPQLASLFPAGPVQAKNEEEIDLSFDGDDDDQADGGGDEERRGEDETGDGGVSAKRQRVGEQQAKNGEEIELDLDQEGEEDA
jgi:hypothetical protein